MDVHKTLKTSGNHVYTHEDLEVEVDPKRGHMTLYTLSYSQEPFFLSPAEVEALKIILAEL